ncbi:oxidoreductase [Planococcus shenhongbingii]|uniref:Oxidoreductase n=1 Tax=Planococcus shenhongbingii TaxID=3058398 RepID=A0ABT8NEX3_9BACL|nr:oxidoreductase [Planococcus sp. N017]MDN7246423.1 oxidoreductase [Planococcus sp. N017]
METKSLTGKTAIITGANSGIGLEAAKVLAGQGARIVMAIRNMEKGKAARQEIVHAYPEAQVKLMPLDLTDLNNIRFFTERFRSENNSLDLLINNAGVMMPPYTKTKDGFELQFGGNHLGHFALTGLLLPLLTKTAGSRVVTIASLAHNRGAIDFNNLDGSQGYKAKKFYNQSKLANLMFALELDKKLKQHGHQTISVACHPGISATNIFKLGKRDAPKPLRRLANFYLQPPEIGALATVYAATNPSLAGGEYIGPDGKGYRKGYPTLETPHAVAMDASVSKRLWEVSEKLTGVEFDFSR